mgnify:CR=1 FL=1
MQKQVILTAQGLKQITDELEDLKSLKREEVAEKIKQARSFGDLSENSEYDEAKDQQGKLFSHEAEVQAILDNYILIDEVATDSTVINLGCNVKVLDLEFDEEQTYHIVGSQEADPMAGFISEESPFGKALIGHVVGDEVLVEAPAGNVRFKVLDISVS